MIGIAGFRPAYGGHGYLAAGAAGVVLGLLLSHVGQRARLPLVVVVAVSALAFLLFGGVVSQTGSVSLPVLRTVANVAVTGWTAAADHRPAGRPHRRACSCCPTCSACSAGWPGTRSRAAPGSRCCPPPRPPPWSRCPSCSARPSRPPPCSRAPASPLPCSPGPPSASSAAPPGRPRSAGSVPGSGSARRSPCSPWPARAPSVVGPHLPGANAHQRVVLYVEPPFDVSAYPSPLAGFRDYTKDVPAGLSVYGEELLATSGLPAGSRVRIAAMDAYDGLSWGVANAGRGLVVRRLPAGRRAAAGGGARQDAGRRRSRSSPATTQPWLPDLADTTGFTFSGTDGSATAAALRFNVATTTGLIPDGVPAGLRYTVSAAAVTAPAPPRSRPRARRARPTRTSLIPAAVQAFAQAHADIGDHPHGQGPRARRVPAGQRTVQQRRRRAERDHRRARLRPAHLVPGGQGDHRRRRAVRRHDGAARERGRRSRPGQP